MKFYLEIFVLTLVTEDAIGYAKKRLEITNNNRDPDDIVHDMIKEDSGDLPFIHRDKCIVHSTSWRYEGQEGIVVTYLVYSDDVDFQKSEAKILPLKDLKIPHGPDPAKPRPPVLREGDIITHGIRHLSFLMEHDNGDRFSRRLNVKTQFVFKTLPFELAGKIK